MGVPAVPLSQLYGDGRAVHRSAWRQGAPARRGRFDSRRCRWRAALQSAAKKCALTTRFWRRRSTASRSCCPTRLSSRPLREQAQHLRDARRSPEFICGSTARSRRWNMRCCWSAPSSGCSRSRRSWRRAGIRRRTAATSSWWSARRRRWSTNRAARSSSWPCANWRNSFPPLREAKLTKATVIKEVHATFSPTPGSDAFRPSHTSPWPRLFLAGDWTATGWPSTMEGAVRSGYGAAEALAAVAGEKKQFLVADLPPQGLMRLFEG